MIETIIQFGIIAICMAAFLDVVVFTGVIFNGVLLLGVATTFFSIGSASGLEIFILAFVGSYTASVANFIFGKRFSNSKKMINIWSSRAGNVVRGRLNGSALLPSMLVLRFITLSRPVYACMLGTMNVSLRKFLALEFIASLVWVGFWTLILVNGYSGISELVKAIW